MLEKMNAQRGPSSAGASDGSSLPKANVPPQAAPKHGALGHLSADEDLQQRVCSALIVSSELDSSGVGVKVVNGTVTLSGSVRSHFERQTALQLTREQAGVRAIVARDLEVRSAQ